MNHDSEILIYQTVDNQIEIQVRFENETVWLTLNQIAELFSRDKSVISSHLNNIYKEGELDKSATVAKNATVQVDPTPIIWTPSERSRFASNTIGLR